MKCGSQTICLSLSEEDWDYCDDEEKDSDCKDFTLLVIGLHFDISIPINKSLTAKPGVEVYWNYAKIFQSWCNNLMQCVLNGNSYTALDLNHWIIPSLHILWTLLLATWYLFSYLIWYKAMLYRHSIESSLLIHLFYLCQRQGCLAENRDPWETAIDPSMLHALTLVEISSCTRKYSNSNGYLYSLKANVRFYNPCRGPRIYNTQALSSPLLCLCTI